MEKRLFTPWSIGLLSVLAFSVMLYMPSLMGGALWDDFDLISGAAFGKNTLLSAFTHPFLGHYFRPLTSASFVIESSFAKGTPFFYHQTNIAIHAITALLVSLLAYLLTKRITAGIASGLFLAAQPMQVGAAAWIGGRTDVLSAMFVAAFMVTLVMYYENKKRSWFATSVVMFFLAAISKEQALALLPAVPLSVFAFGSRKWDEVKKISIPYAVAVLLFIGMWIVDAPPPSRAQNTLLGTILLALRTLAHYGLAFLVPTRRSLMTWTLEGYHGAMWVFVGALLLGLIVWFLRYTWKDHRPITWIAVCGLLVYMPISNFPTVPSFVLGPYRCAEAGTAVACLFGIGLAWTLTPKRCILAIPFVANFVAGLLVSSVGIKLWSNAGDFFKAAATTDPHFIVGVGNYAHGLTNDGKPQESLKWTNELLTWIFGTKQWRRVLRTKRMAAFTPAVKKRLQTNGGSVDYRSLGWFISNQAESYSHMKKTADALEVEKDALMISPQDARTHFAYGQIVLSFDRPEAIAHWEYALKIMPRYNACAAALAHERVADHQYAAAINLLEPIMSDMGWNSQLWFDLSDAKIGLHDYAGAATALANASKAVFVKPDEIAAHRKKLQALIDADKTAKKP